MQKDFHFYAIYVLCRCNGMSPGNAKRIAYASQHTDDAKYDHPLNFENGGRFQQVLSAHKYVHPGVFSLASQYNIYVPFHFIPGNQGERFQERMECRQESEIVQKMVQKVSTFKDKPYQLHRLGIALHVYADSWSHHDFSGLQSELNDIEDIIIENDDQAGIARVFRNFFRSVAEALIPNIGHVEAAMLPDEPYRQWKYFDQYRKETHNRKNWIICQDACRGIYREIKRFLSNNFMMQQQAINFLSKMNCWLQKVLFAANTFLITDR